AEVARERLADLGLGRLGVIPQERVTRDDESRRTEPALHRSGVDEGTLHRMEPLVLPQVLDRPDAMSFGRGGQDEATAQQLIVEENRARTAFALLARVLAAGQPEVLPQRRQQGAAFPDVGLALEAVDRQVDPHATTDPTRSRARRAITPSTWRRYRAEPRTSSIGRAAAATSSPKRAAAASLTSSGSSQPLSSMSSSAKRSASPALRIVGPHEPRATRTLLRARSTTRHREATAITIAFSVPTLRS